MNGSTDSLIGHVFNNTYRIDRLLADGGMGQVYVAEQLSLARLIVLKVLQPGFSDDDFIQLFLREARINSQVNHPNIVSVIDFGQSEEGVVFLAMEFLSGQNVSEWVKCQGAMSLANVVWIMEQVVGGVQAAHKLHFIHRDIKPANILYYKIKSGGYFTYVINGKNYYIPNFGYLIIINDFGIAHIYNPKDKIFNRKNFKWRKKIWY
ncbi:MAG: serine/threonine protein kinase [Mycoplasmataceae bacterium]|nr:serine/threonine protein kinase [Mycoplasmataceae bacterium]